MKEPVVEPPVVKPAEWDWRKFHLRIAALLIAGTTLLDGNSFNETKGWTLAAALIVFALSCNKRGASR